MENPWDAFAGIYRCHNRKIPEHRIPLLYRYKHNNGPLRRGGKYMCLPALYYIKCMYIIPLYTYRYPTSNTNGSTRNPIRSLEKIYAKIENDTWSSFFFYIIIVVYF